MTRREEIEMLVETLHPAVTSGRCVAFLGSGLSCAAGYHDWIDLVARLCEVCGSSLRPTRESSSIELLRAADDARTRDHDAYDKYLCGHFGKCVTVTNQLYATLGTIPFRAFLTTNFDPLLVRAIKTSPGSEGFYAYPGLNYQQVDKKAVLYLHGAIREGAENLDDTRLVLTESDFNDAYAPGAPLVSTLTQTLDNDTICFVACQLREPVLECVFERCNKNRELIRQSAQGVPPPQRFILLQRQVATDARVAAATEASQTAFYERRDIRPLWYPNDSDGSHAALHEVFNHLAGIVPRVPESPWKQQGALPS